MLSVQVVLATLFLHAASASAEDLTAPGFPNMTACSGSINPPVGCVTIPIVSDSCFNFVGGASGLNKEISWVQVPAEYVCTYFQNFGCLAVEEDDHTMLTNGTWNMLDLPTASGTQNFNDLTSSFNCVHSDGAASDV
ncbi:hypothetical protein B0H16DRAFT_1642417 [Mycena metata]|uniref:Uncharacterized protein n=1 Tax=Mycena metata TaxID=1033252 RepID=A0AAD7DVA4_9AGAR|nr:hypothetical protein B0H16DRAFT_1642417 [Mycena metata]